MPSGRSSSGCCSSICSIRPVRWLARRGVRRSIAIIVVYVIALMLFLEFLNLTLTPLINEIVRLLRDLPGLAQQLQEQADRISEIYDSAGDPRRDTAVDRIDDRVDHPGWPEWRPGLRPDRSPASAHGRDQRHRRPVRVRDPTGLGLLHPERPRRADEAVRPEPATGLAFRRLGRDPDRPPLVQPMGTRPADPRRDGRRIHLRRVAHLERDRGPDLRAVRDPALGHRGDPRAAADHRTDHLGDPGDPPRGNRGDRGGHRRVRPVPHRPAGREQRARAEDPGRCDRAPPCPW